MSLKNSSATYGSVAKFFHWAVFFAVAGLLTVGLTMIRLSDTSPLKNTLFHGHELTGLTVLTLMLLRVVWRWMNIKPTLPRNMPAWEKIAERIVHRLFYVALFLMPLSGWSMSTAAGYPPALFFGIQLPFPGIHHNEALSKILNTVHETTAWILIGLIIIHVAAALKHHFLDRDNVLRTML